MAKKRNFKKWTTEYPPTIDWNDYDVVEGSVIDHKEVKLSDGPVNVTVLELETGEQISIWQSAGLKHLTEIPVGAFVRIENKGMERSPKTKRMFRKFEILVDESTLPEELF